MMALWGAATVKKLGVRSTKLPISFTLVQIIIITALSLLSALLITHNIIIIKLITHNS